jgi:hypothetical protein
MFHGERRIFVSLRFSRPGAEAENRASVSMTQSPNHSITQFPMFHVEHYQFISFVHCALPDSSGRSFGHGARPRLPVVPGKRTPPVFDLANKFTSSCHIPAGARPIPAAGESVKVATMRGNGNHGFEGFYGLNELDDLAT